MSDIKKDKNDMSLIKKDTFSSKKIAQYIDNEYERYLVLKTEKLGSAIYVVTNFVQENDPIRQKLREAAIVLISMILQKGDVDMENKVRSTCLEISGLLSIAERAGLISPMNSQVLSDEYASLVEFIEQHSDKLSTSKTLQFEDQTPLPQEKRKRISPIVKDRIKVPDKRHTSRRDKILEIFNTKSEISVKDAAIAIGGVSEKTVQRELLAMVSEGVLLKEGERRWSTYKKA